jgi:hypothetical protein
MKVCASVPSVCASVDSRAGRCGSRYSAWQWAGESFIAVNMPLLTLSGSAW